LGRVLVEIASMAMPGRLSQAGQIVVRRQELQGRSGARVKEVHSSMYDAGFVTQARQGPNLVRPLINTIFKEGCLSSPVISSKRLLRLLFGHFSPLLTCFGKSNGDGLLLTLHRAALTAFAGLEGAAFFAVHSTLDALTCGAAILCHEFSFTPSMTCGLCGSLEIDS